MVIFASQFYQCIISHLERFDRDPRLVLLLHHLNELGDDLVHHVVDVSATLSTSVTLDGEPKKHNGIVVHTIMHKTSVSPK